MTIAKNTNRAKQAIANAHNIRCFSLNNNFSGQPLCADPVAWVRNGLEKPELKHLNQQEFLSNELFGQHLHPRLSLSDGKFVLHIHDNLWYEFEA